MILEFFPSGPADTNGILLGCSKTLSGALIDAPLGGGSTRVLRALDLGLKLEFLALTHTHWDHTVEAKDLKQEQRLPIYVHSLDAENLRQPGSDGLPLFFPIKAVEPDRLLKDGDEIFLGKLRIEVLHTPGHSPGGICFYLPAEQMLISGDTLFKGTIGNLSFPTAQPELMRQSLIRLSQLPKQTRVVPGHGEETTIEQELSTLKYYIKQLGE